MIDELDQLAALIYSLKMVRSKNDSFCYRDLLGLIVKLQKDKSDLAPKYKVLISEAGPWSVHCALDIMELQRREALEVRDVSEQDVVIKYIAPNGKLQEICQDSDQQYLSKLRNMIQRLDDDCFNQEHVPWRWAKHWCYDEFDSINADNGLKLFNKWPAEEQGAVE